MLIDRLYLAAQEKGPVCVGLDTQLSFLPACILEKNETAGERIYEFNRLVIDATLDIASCYKIQIACYEALGLDGMRAYAASVRYARERGAVVIADVKRGDISSTATLYAKGHFTGDFEADFMTINAYMGEDAVSPYYPYMQEKGLFILVKTSNASSGDIQDLSVHGEPVYARMARLLEKWGRPYTGACGFSSLGAVVGLTYPEEIASLRALMPHTFCLVPGYGAQGGTAQDLAPLFKNGVCGVVNSSRALLTAHKGHTEEYDFSQHVRAATIAMRDEIRAIIR